MEIFRETLVATKGVQLMVNKGIPLSKDVVIGHG